MGETKLFVLLASERSTKNGTRDSVIPISRRWGLAYITGPQIASIGWAPFWCPKKYLQHTHTLHSRCRSYPLWQWSVYKVPSCDYTNDQNGRTVLPLRRNPDSSEATKMKNTLYRTHTDTSDITRKHVLIAFHKRIMTAQGDVAKR